MPPSIGSYPMRLKRTAMPRVESGEKEPLGFINGIQADSREEWFWANSAWSLGWAGRFHYQLPLGGGSQRRGGQILDFLFMARPVALWTHIDGVYWHDPNRDAFERGQTAYLLLREYGIVAEPAEVPQRSPGSVTTDLLSTQEASDRLFLQVIGRY